MPESEKKEDHNSGNALDDFVRKQFEALAEVQASLEKATAEFKELIQLQMEKNKVDKDK